MGHIIHGSLGWAPIVLESLFIHVIIYRSFGYRRFSIHHLAMMHSRIQLLVTINALMSQSGMESLNQLLSLLGQALRNSC